MEQQELDLGNHAERAHSEVGASSAERWMTCPASVRLSREIPDESNVSPYAAEGTAAHELAEECLMNNGLAETYIGVEFNGFVVDEEMAEAVQLYLDVVMKDWEAIEDSELLVEERFHLDHIHEDLFGSNDACLIQDNGKVIVYDYKHGKGIPVEAEENKQLMYYALGAVKGAEFSSVELVIVQPRANHPEGPVRRWKVTKKRLNEFKKELKQAVLATKEPDAQLVPSEKGCKWCRAKATCGALKQQVYNYIDADFDEVSETTTLPEPSKLSNEQIVRVLDAAPMIKDFLEAVQKHAHIQAEKGLKLPGFKLVKKRATRKWKDEAAVISLFSGVLDKDDLFEKKILSPAKLEKIVGKSDVAKLTTTPDTGNVLVSVSDKRPEVVPAIESDFDEVEEDLDI